MSRIHDALKKAEQEKAAGYNGQNGDEPAERTASSRVIEAEIPPLSVSLPALVSQVKTETLPEVLRFEELWANCARPQWQPDSSFLVFVNSDPFNPGTEQFRTLRSRLYRMREGQPLNTLLISSAVAAEGKTIIATNLAYAIVRQHGCRALLIDADLRSPRIHTLLGSPSTPGLADYLQGGANEFEVIQRGREEGLCFIPAGNHVTHPSELISSDRMKQLLARLKPAFDWIIIDSPPSLPVADASVLGRLCDGVLFVIRGNSTPSVAAKKACKELQNTNVIGVVLNTVEDPAEYGSYATYGGNYLPRTDHSKK